MWQDEAQLGEIPSSPELQEKVLMLHRGLQGSDMLQIRRGDQIVLKFHLKAGKKFESTDATHREAFRCMQSILLLSLC